MDRHHLVKQWIRAMVMSILKFISLTVIGSSSIVKLNKGKRDHSCILSCVGTHLCVMRALAQSDFHRKDLRKRPHKYFMVSPFYRSSVACTIPPFNARFRWYLRGISLPVYPAICKWFLPKLVFVSWSYRPGSGVMSSNWLVGLFRSL